jgi:GTP-binding protein Era
MPEDGAMAEPTAGRRCGFVAIAGAPNVGKSTLVNRLVGTKVTIVSPKAQTTRLRVLGIVAAGTSQVIMVDTPGLFAPRFRLDSAMVDAAWRSIADADAVVVLVDAVKAANKAIDPAIAAIAASLRARDRRAVAAINKVDLVAKPGLLVLAERLAGLGVFDPLFMLSALTGDGVDDLLAWLAPRLPEGPWLFDADDVSDLPAAVLASEITREQLYRRLSQELPYACAVRPERWQDQGDGSVRIEQLIVVERPAQKGIVIGKGGRQLKEIGARARKEMETLLARPVHLFLRVVVREHWRDSADGWRWHRLEAPGP